MGLRARGSGCLAGLLLVATALGGCDRWDALEPTSAADGTVASPAGDLAAPSTEPPSDGPPSDKLTDAGPADWSLENDAATITLVKGADVESLVTEFAGRRAPRFRSFEQAVSWTDGDPYRRGWVVIGQIDGWGYVREDNYFLGSTDTTAERLSDGTTFASFFWNVNLDMRFTLARNGRIVRAFDPFEVDAQGGGLGRRLPQERGLTWENVPPDGLLLLTGVTGTPVADETWLERTGSVIVGATREG